MSRTLRASIRQRSILPFRRGSQRLDSKGCSRVVYLDSLLFLLEKSKAESSFTLAKMRHEEQHGAQISDEQIEVNQCSASFHPLQE